MSCASTTAIAAILTISSTSAPRASRCTGFAHPHENGSEASPPPIFASNLQAMLADCRSGKISTLAPPFSVLKRIQLLQHLSAKPRRRP